MTMRTPYPVACVCGQTGTLMRAENDQPYGDCWESYSLIGFTARGVDTAKGPAGPAAALHALRGECPSCKRRGELHLAPDA